MLYLYERQNEVTLADESKILVDGENAQVDRLRLVVPGHVMLVAVETFCIILIEHAFVLFHGFHVRLDGVGCEMLVDEILSVIVSLIVHNFKIIIIMRFWRAMMPTFKVQR